VLIGDALDPSGDGLADMAVAAPAYFDTRHLAW
jgi:hypothetical protein